MWGVGHGLDASPKSRPQLAAPAAKLVLVLFQGERHITGGRPPPLRPPSSWTSNQMTATAACYNQAATLTLHLSPIPPTGIGGRRRALLISDRGRFRRICSLGLATAEIRRRQIRRGLPTSPIAAGPRLQRGLCLYVRVHVRSVRPAQPIPVAG